MKIQHSCPYCKRESKRSAQAIAENPFCGACLNERRANTEPTGPFQIRRTVYENGRVRYTREPLRESKS